MRRAAPGRWSGVPVLASPDSLAVYGRSGTCVPGGGHAAPWGDPGGHGRSAPVGPQLRPQSGRRSTAMAIPSVNLADPDGLATLPDAWEQARRWLLSPARLAQHRQQNRCHHQLLDRFLG